MSKPHRKHTCTSSGHQPHTCQVWSQSDERFLRYARDRHTYRHTEIPCFYRRMLLISSVHLRRALHRPLVLRGILSWSPMASMKNHSFNCDRCCPFSSNNDPLLKRDWDVNYIIASDVLYGKAARNMLFSPIFIIWHLQRSGSWDRTTIGSFWNKALGIVLQLAQEVSNSLFCEWMHLFSLTQTVAGCVLLSQT